MNQQSEARIFAKHLSRSLVGQMSGIAAGVAVSIILARWLGPELRGQYALAILLPSTLIALIASGFNAPIVHFIATQTWPENRITANVLGIGVPLTLLSIACGIAAVLYSESILPGVQKPLLAGSLALIPLQIAQGSLNAILTGKQAFRRIMVASLVTSPLQLVTNLILIVFLDLGIPGALFSAILTSALGTTITAFHVRHELGTTNFTCKPETNLAPLKSALNFGVKSHIANLAGFLNYRIDMFLVNLMLGSVDAGIYVVAVGLVEKLWILVSALAGVIFPTVSAESAKNADKSARFTSKIASIMLLALAIAAIVMSAVAIPFINIVYGTAYSRAGLVTIILVPGVALLGYGRLLANHIAGTGHPEVTAFASTLGLAINLTANVILIPRFGLPGAAASTTLSYSIISFYYYYKFVKLTAVPPLLPVTPNLPSLLALFKQSPLSPKH